MTIQDPLSSLNPDSQQKGPAKGRRMLTANKIHNMLIHNLQFQTKLVYILKYLSKKFLSFGVRVCTTYSQQEISVFNVNLMLCVSTTYFVV